MMLRESLMPSLPLPQIAVYLAVVAPSSNDDMNTLLVRAIDHAVFADGQPPVSRSLQCLRVARERLCKQVQNRADHLAALPGRQFLQFLEHCLVQTQLPHPAGLSRSVSSRIASLSLAHCPVASAA